MAPDVIARISDAAARAQGAAIDRLALPPLEQRVAALHAARKDRARARGRRLMSGLAAVAAVAGVVALFCARPRPLEFDVGAARARGIPGARLEAPASRALPLHFSDGTEVLLAESARGRVVSLAAAGAEIVLERGTLRAAVVHRPASAWVVAVGPFDVHVKGTRFDATWSPGRETFTLRMYDGIVTITGRCLAAPRTLGAGEEVELTCAQPGATAAVTPAVTATPAGARAPTATLTPTPSGKPAGAPALTVASRRERPRLAGVISPEGSQATRANEGPSAETSPRLVPGSWQALLAVGDAAGALEALQRSDGLAEACSVAPAENLMQLGDVARALGRRALAVRLYTSVRARFPGGDLAAVAAFHLGQVAFDQGGGRAEARAGFAAYLAERPDGPLAQDALGRLLEIDRLADAAAAPELARRYLARFPRGPHAALARSIAGP